MGLSEQALEEARATLARVEEAKVDADRRAHVCSCGHTVAKHIVNDRGSICIQGHGRCPCREVVEALKVPNARVFSYKTDEAGHAVMKGVGRTALMGLAHRLEWLTTCVDCEEEPVTVKAVDDGKRNEPRCEVHR